MEELNELIKKYLDGRASPEEKSAVENWYRQVNQADIEIPVDSKEEPEETRARMLARLQAAIHEQKPVRRIPSRIWAAAASIIILSSAAGGYYYFRQVNRDKALAVHENQSIVAQDITAPKNNRATITLASGQKVFLDSAARGTLAVQGNVKVEKLADGRIAYAGAATPKSDIEYNTEYNTLSNPRGSKVIDITLSDGTQVWLNAESSLKYPVAFSGNERKVEIIGEAYFEVVHDASKPFRVKTGNQLVEDLGTHFNIKAYDNEAATVTTLLKGKIKIIQGETTEILRPGQQLFSDHGSGEIKVNDNADLDLTIAWKNGLQSFSNADVQTIMREVERWYDVDVSYEGTIAKRTFNGDIPRSANLSEVLKLFDVNKIHFTIDAAKKRLIVKP